MKILRNFYQRYGDRIEVALFALGIMIIVAVLRNFFLGDNISSMY